MDQLIIGERPLTIADITDVARRGRTVGLGPAARERLAAARAVVERILAEDRVVYGVTTGFGLLATTRIPARPGAQAAAQPHPQPRRGRRRAAAARRRAGGHAAAHQHDRQGLLGRAHRGARDALRAAQRRPRALGAVARLAGRVGRPRPLGPPRARHAGRGRVPDRRGRARAGRPRACRGGHRADHARGQRGPLAAQRHAVHGGHRLPRRDRRRGAARFGRRHRRHEPRGPARLGGALRGAHPAPAAHPGAAAHRRSTCARSARAARSSSAT